MSERSERTRNAGCMIAGGVAMKVSFHVHIICLALSNAGSMPECPGCPFVVPGQIF